jgi:hypothetical protein
MLLALQVVASKVAVEVAVVAVVLNAEAVVVLVVACTYCLLVD